MREQFLTYFFKRNSLKIDQYVKLALTPKICGCIINVLYFNQKTVGRRNLCFPSSSNILEDFVNEDRLHKSILLNIGVDFSSDLKKRFFQVSSKQLLYLNEFSLKIFCFNRSKSIKTGLSLSNNKVGFIQNLHSA